MSSGSRCIGSRGEGAAGNGKCVCAASREHAHSEYEFGDVFEGDALFGLV